MARQLQPCGTDAAYHRHHAYSEPIDAACAAAHAAKNAPARRIRGKALEQLAREHPGRFLELVDQYRKEAAAGEPR